MTWPGNGSSKNCSVHLATVISFSISTPVSKPMLRNIKHKSSVAILPVARGANGQPPIPPIDESRKSTPATAAAAAFAKPVFLVLCKFFSQLSFEQSVFLNKHVHHVLKYNKIRNLENINITINKFMNFFFF